MNTPDEQVPAKRSRPSLPPRDYIYSVMMARSAELTAQARAPLDPKVLAQQRRDAGDEQQLAWDKATNPAAMMRALLAHQPDPAVLLPAARFIEYATHRFRERGILVSPTIWDKTMHTSARMLGSGDFNGACVWLQHAYTGAGLAISVEHAHREMCGMVRYFFPVAPPDWDQEHAYGQPTLDEPRKVWRALNPPRR